MSEPAKAAPAASQRQVTIAHNFIFLGGGQIAGLALGIILTAIVARTLGPSDYGIYFLVGTISATVAVVGDWGQTSYVVREIARGRPARAEFLGSAAVLRTVATLVAAGVALAFAFASGYSSLVVLLIGFSVIAGYPTAIVGFLGLALRGIDRTDVDVLAQLLTKAFVTFAIMLALYLGGGLVAAVIMPGVGGAIALHFTLRMFRKAGLGIAPPTGTTMRELLVAGAPLVAMSLTIAAHGLIDVALLAMLTSSAVVGWLGAVRAFVGILISPATILAMASFPELSRASDSPQELRKVISTSARPLLAAGALAACGVFTLALPAVQLVYGRTHFDPAAVVLQVCAPFFPVFFLNFLMGYAAIALGKSNHIAIAKAACVAISALLSWLLIRYFQATTGNGAVGVMISFCASEVMMTIAYVAILPTNLITRETLGVVARAYLAAAIVSYIGVKAVPMVPLWVAFPLIPALFAVIALMTGLVRLSDIGLMLGMAYSLRDRLTRSIR